MQEDSPDAKGVDSYLTHPNTAFGVLQKRRLKTELTEEGLIRFYELRKRREKE
jgi:hypothetical protein